MAQQLQLYGRVFIKGSIVAITGLHIGGSGGAFTIGGVDKPVITDPLTNEPYIPGSSLRGKMRSLTEKYLGATLVEQARVQMHTCRTAEEYEKSPVGNIYGIPAEDFNLPTRLIVRDVPLTPESCEALRAARTALPFTEVKTEVAIDRVTSRANPRQIERVPAGAVFGPLEMVYSIYEERDVDRFANLVDGMELLEDDYLGAYGSRGSGKVRFENLSITLKRARDYRNPYDLRVEQRLSDLSANLPDLLNTIWQYMFSGA